MVLGQRFLPRWSLRNFKVPANLDAKILSKTLTDTSSIADVFNSYFASIGTNRFLVNRFSNF